MKVAKKGTLFAQTYTSRTKSSTRRMKNWSNQQRRLTTTHHRLEMLPRSNPMLRLICTEFLRKTRRHPFTTKNTLWDWTEETKRLYSTDKRTQ